MLKRIKTLFDLQNKLVLRQKIRRLASEPERSEQQSVSKKSLKKDCRKAVLFLFLNKPIKNLTCPLGTAVNFDVEVMMMLLKEMLERSGVTRKQLEIIQKKGFLSPERDANGYRLYTEVDVTRVRQILFLRKFNLTLNECFALLIQKDTACLVDRREQIRAEIYRMDTALQYLELLEKPQAERPDMEEIMRTFELYDQISGEEEGKKIIRMEQEISASGIRFDRFREGLSAVGLFLSAAGPSEDIRCFTALAVLFFNFQLRNSTRFRWLLVRAARFLRLI